MNRRIVKIIASALMCGCMLLLCSCGSQEAADKNISLAALPLGENLVEKNPYMAEGESIIHNDVYSSDVTSCIVPLGIYPEVTSAQETEADKAIPCFFYDSDRNCITPYSLKTEKGVISGGVAIRDVNSDPVKTLGSFLPVRDDGQPYGIQISYAFVDNNGFVTGAATNGHILMLRTKDENGEILTKFEKAVDVDVLTAARSRLGDDIDPNLMSVIMDYDGNLWFTTGGFRINPQYAKDGFIGYIDREYIDAVIGGKEINAENYIHVYRLGEGEGAENGISSHPKGCVILTNKACYLLNASEEGVKVEWRTPYESEGGSTECADPDITGAGLAWGKRHDADSHPGSRTLYRQYESGESDSSRCEYG